LVSWLEVTDVYNYAYVTRYELSSELNFDLCHTKFRIKPRKWR